jgi:hypothetical protein
MAWTYDASAVDIAWKVSVEYSEQTQIGSIEMGTGGDLAIDTGERDNSTSLIDQGLRVL